MLGCVYDEQRENAVGEAGTQDCGCAEGKMMDDLRKSECQTIRDFSGGEPLIVICKSCGKESPCLPGTRVALESTCWICLAFGPESNGDLGTAVFGRGR